MFMQCCHNKTAPTRRKKEPIRGGKGGRWERGGKGVWESTEVNGLGRFEMIFTSKMAIWWRAETCARGRAT